MRDAEDAAEDPRAREWRRPPNQNLIRRFEHWPVVGETEALPVDGPWTVAVAGLVAHPRSWSLDELRARPRAERVVDLHCVTRWSKLGCRFAGVRLMDLIAEAGPSSEAASARFVARTARAHDTALTLADVQRCDPLIAYEYEGAPLPEDHGGPVRVVTPGKYFYKSCKWLAEIRLEAEHKLGYWESGPGYHDNADPWREERYVTGSISPDLRRRMIAQRRFGGRDLLSCVFDGEDLSGLDARDATLRNTSFVAAALDQADFSNARLVNARLNRASLQKARFLSADVMGADFREADLRGADFTGAEIFGASFCDESGGAGARFDAETRLAPAQFATLTDVQAEYARRALADAGAS